MTEASEAAIVRLGNRELRENDSAGSATSAYSVSYLPATMSHLVKLIGYWRMCMFRVNTTSALSYPATWHSTLSGSYRTEYYSKLNSAFVCCAFSRIQSNI